MTAVASDAPAPTEPEAAPTTHRKLGAFITISAAIGLWASVVLTLDKISLLQAKIDGVDKSLSCDLSAFVSCSDVVTSSQSEAFGIPNTIIGIVAFAALAALGVLLWSGARFPGWIWGGLQLGVIFGIGFVTWLQYQAIFEIGKLCPWCMVVWTVMIPLFVLVTARNLRSALLRNWAGLVIALWYIAVIATIWFTFGSTLWA